MMASLVGIPAGDDSDEAAVFHHRQTGVAIAHHTTARLGDGGIRGDRARGHGHDLPRDRFPADVPAQGREQPAPRRLHVGAVEDGGGGPAVPSAAEIGQDLTDVSRLGPGAADDVDRIRHPRQHEDQRHVLQLRELVRQQRQLVHVGPGR